VDGQVPDFVLRPETVADEEFLRALYVSVRWDELVVTGWLDEAKIAFLTSQFQLQKQQYTTNYSALERWIVEHTDGPIGRLYIWRSDSELRVVDISLLPEWRGHGIGTGLLQELGRQADQYLLPLRLHVEQNNPVLRLYKRLGFETLDASGIYWLMERRVS